MTTVRGAIENTVPISSFNRGLAGKIFAEVKRTGPKVVMRNNVAECVLLSPQDYIKLLDELEEAKLLSLAEERMAHYNPTRTIPAEEVYRELGIAEDDLADAGEVEFE